MEVLTLTHGTWNAIVVLKSQSSHEGQVINRILAPVVCLMVDPFGSTFHGYIPGLQEYIWDRCTQQLAGVLIPVLWCKFVILVWPTRSLWNWPIPYLLHWPDSHQKKVSEDIAEVSTYQKIKKCKSDSFITSSFSLLRWSQPKKKKNTGIGIWWVDYSK